MDQIKFAKNEYGKVKHEISTNYDPRPLQYQTTTSNKITCLHHQLHATSCIVTYNSCASSTKSSFDSSTTCSSIYTNENTKSSNERTSTDFTPLSV